MFQNLGAGAYKPGLETTRRLAEAFGSPEKKLRTIHIGGTNGKGSTTSTIAAILQSAGYRTGLFTSPHLVDFRERIRVDGVMIPEEYVCEFVDRYLADPVLTALHPTFFELTTVMALRYFADCGVDAAVIEVGLGGRLDSTNIITPELTVVTNISLDHTQFLGSTLPEIAGEKAGIIKPGVPVVVGEAEGDVRRVFADKAAAEGAPITFACESPDYISARPEEDCIVYEGTPYGTLRGQLTGDCQPRNAATILAATGRLIEAGYHIGAQDVARGMAHVCDDTGLAGRWMVVGRRPTVVCDTGHNAGGWQYLAPRLASLPGVKHMVLGFVSDKDVSHILGMMPKDAKYYFTQASIARAMPADELAEAAACHGLQGEIVPDVEAAYKKALGECAEGGMVFVGGSTFVVADLLASIDRV